MLISEDFIEVLMHNYELNKAQFKILGLSYPPREGWETLIIGQVIPDEEVSLLLLLRGKLALKAQEQIVRNYKLMLNFNYENIEVNLDKNPILVETTSVIEIYCDGACINNPGKAGSGLAIYKNGTNPILLYGNYTEYGTNNTAELNAFYKALLIATKLKSFENIIIYSDSKYSIDCITNWAYGWKNKSWTKKGGEIKNLEVIKSAHCLYDKIKDKVVVKHVKGHSGVEGNELADRMAMLAISSKNKDYNEFKYDNLTEVLKLNRG